MSRAETKAVQPGLLRRLSAEWWAVAALLSVVVLGLVRSDGLVRFDTMIYDAFVRANSAPVRQDIVIVDIDSRSLTLEGPWPWPRDKQARLVDAIARARPASLTYNILLTDSRDAEADSLLAQSFSRAGAPVHLPVSLEAQGGGETHRFLVVPPDPLFASVASSVGQTTAVIDPDGLVRRSYLSLPASGRAWPNLVSWALQGRQETGGGRLPGAGEPILLPFAGRGRFTHVSAASLLADPNFATGLAGRHVLVGVSATGVETSFATPLSGSIGYMSGTEIEAQLLSALLDGRQLQVAGPVEIALLSLLPLWLMLLLLRLTGPGPALTCGAALGLAFLLFARFAFGHWGLWIPPGAGLAGPLLAYPIWSWRRLAAIMAFVGDQLARLRPDTGLVEHGGVIDPLIARAGLLADAIARAQSMHRFIEDVVEQLPSPALVLSCDGAIAFRNAAAQDLLAQFEPADRDVRDLAAFLRPLALDLAASSGSMEVEGNSSDAMSKAGATESDSQIEVIAPDGSHWELIAEPLKDEAGAIYAWIVLMANISQVKAAIQQREEVLQLLTHDMRSPLVSILSLLGREPDSASTVDLGRIRRFATRAVGLADEYVMLARVRGGAMFVEPVSLRLLLEDALDEIAPRAERAGVALELSGDPDPWYVDGDADLLMRCIVNLLDNAIRYGASGGRVDCRVTNHRTGSARQVKVEVRDWGEGVSEERASKLFTRFERLPQHRAGSGAGLGLAFVKAVAQRHGGTISCESRAGGGAAFILSLPASQDQHTDDVEEGSDLNHGPGPASSAAPVIEAGDALGPRTASVAKED